MTINKLISLEQLNPVVPPTKAGVAKTPKTQPSAFDKVLASETSGIKFSSHAQQRIRSRNISFGDQELNLLQNAVAMARDKGARESLILMGDMALVVSIRNNTVITALNGESIKENVFTNIDSAVVL
ncbi:MAG: TIGR02530 family flagellar biosynthesis protein [Syntrophomonadales bacterium]